MIDVVGLLGDRKVEAHSSIVLTYGFDLLLYDGFLRRQLRGAGATNQMVFCDFRCYERALSSVAASRFLGKKYSVTPVHQTAAFHPKIYLLLGSRRGRMIIGSGNTTLSGLTRNAELFGAFDFDERSDAGPHPAFAAVMQFVRSLADAAPQPVRMQLERAVSRASWLSQPPVADGRQLLLGGPSRPPLLDQLQAAIGSARIETVLVCSASFDRHLLAMESLANLSGGTAVTCLVQPENVTLDGAAVQQLGRRIEWKLLSLAHLRRKADAADAFGHAKLYVFGAGDQEFVAYGSANASAPALLRGDAPNTEVLVLLPAMKRGTVVEKLALAQSLESPSIYASLCGLAWPPADDVDAPPAVLRLCGIALDRDRALATFSVNPGQVELRVALAMSPDTAPPVAILRIAQREDGQWSGVWSGEPSAVRVGWVVDAEGQQISNAVAITWREVAECLSSSGMGRKYDDAIAAIQDGQLLSTALYGLLDHVDDLPRGSTRSAEELTPGETTETVEPRSQASFYSDQVVTGGHSAYSAAERMDLDLLASLVQPLPVSGPREDDGWLPNEEDERKSLDAGGTDGQSGADQGDSLITVESGTLNTTIATIEKLSRRLARRLERAAQAAEDALGLTNFELSTAAIARQLWMTHIAAFLAGREVVADDGPAVCLSPDVFARYTMRLAHALAGGKGGGLLGRVPPSTWTGHDGQNIKRGLAFAWTCVAWAAAHLRRHWLVVAEKTEHPTALAEAVPELVASRFVHLARRFCDGPDETELSRRLPATVTLSPAERTESGLRLDRVLLLLDACETTPPQAFPEVPPRVDPGTFVYSAGLGVTVAVRSESGRIELIDLSRPLRANNGRARAKDKQPPPWLVTFRSRVASLGNALEGINTCWRPTRELIDLWRQQDRRS